MPHHRSAASQRGAQQPRPPRSKRGELLVSEQLGSRVSQRIVAFGCVEKSLQPKQFFLFIEASESPAPPLPPKKVFWALRRNASLLHLDLSDNRAGAVFGTEADKLEEYGTTSINSALSLNQTLRFLDLGTNGLSAECGSTLTASIRRNRSLANISLENNLLDDQAASTFARKLRRDRQIEHLNLNNNRVGWRGGLDLAASLALNSHLVWLDLGNNMLGEAGTFADVGGKFATALVRNKTLTRLNIEGNKLGPSGGVAIAKALHRNNSLVDLNLENNR